VSENVVVINAQRMSGYYGLCFRTTQVASSFILDSEQFNTDLKAFEKPMCLLFTCAAICDVHNCESEEVRCSRHESNHGKYKNDFEFKLILGYQMPGPWT
jgi:hypothetical protein